MYEELTENQTRELIIRKFEISKELEHTFGTTVALIRELLSYLHSKQVINYYIVIGAIDKTFIDVIFYYENYNTGHFALRPRGITTI